MPVRSTLFVIAFLSLMPIQVSAAELLLIDQYRRVSAFDHPTHNQAINFGAGYWQGDETVIAAAVGRAQQESTITTTVITGSSTLSHINFGTGNANEPIISSELKVLFSVSEETTVRLTGTLSRGNTVVANSVLVSFDSAAPELPDYIWRLTDDIDEIQIDELVQLTPGSYQLRAYGYTLHSVPGDSSRSWSVELAIVPEPSSLALLAGAGLLIGRQVKGRRH